MNIFSTLGLESSLQAESTQDMTDAFKDSIFRTGFSAGDASQRSANTTLFDDAYDFGSKSLRTGKILVEGTLVGAYEYGKDRVRNDLPGLLLETGTYALIGAGVVAAMIAAPSWATKAISVIGLAGAICITKQVGERLADCLPALKAAWNSPDKEAEAMDVVGKNLGSYVFDYTLATAAGIGGGIAAHQAAVGLAGTSGSLGKRMSGLLSESRFGEKLTLAVAKDAASDSSYLPDIQQEAVSLLKLSSRVTAPEARNIREVVAPITSGSFRPVLPEGSLLGSSKIGLKSWGTYPGLVRLSYVEESGRQTPSLGFLGAH